MRAILGTECEEGGGGVLILTLLCDPHTGEAPWAYSAAHAAHFLCGEESVSGVGSKNTSGTTLTFGPPHILHFATNSKPWIATQHSYYQALWLRHNRSWRRP